MQITALLPDPNAILKMGHEEVASYILEHLNAEAVNDALRGADRYQINERNYLNDIEQAYKNADVTNLFFAAWRWLIDRRFLAEVPSPLMAGWYRLTAQGRAITQHDMLQVPRVPRDFNPGRPPNFRAIAYPALAKHLDVLWEEAALCYEKEANLSAIIMLGSLLEGALLAKCLANDAVAKAAPHAPKGDNGRVKNYRWWMLTNFIAVAVDNKWIHQSRNDFAGVLRGYRNMIHPFNAANLAYRVDKPTVTISWEVVKAALGDLGVNF